MFRKHVGAKAVILTILLGASSLVAQQQPPPSGATQNSQQSPTEVMAKGRLDGQMSAQGVGTGGWMTGGVVTGLLTGLIGTAIIYVAAGSSDVSLPADRRVQIAGEPPTYQQAYEAGFGEKLKGKRKGAALAGGLLGTAALVLIVVSSSGESQ